MDLLKAEIERKRKAVELAKSSKEVGRVGGSRTGGSDDGGGGGTNRQYLKASDLRRFHERQEEEEEERRRGGGRSRVGAGDKARKRRRDEPPEPPGDSKSVAGRDGSDRGDKLMQGADSPAEKGVVKDDGAARKGRREHEDRLEPEEVTRLLRELGLPVRLFGERTAQQEDGTYDDSQRLERLHEARESRRAAMAGMSEMDEFRLGSGHGIRNPFLGGKKRGGDKDGEGEKDELVKRAKLDTVSGTSGPSGKMDHSGKKEGKGSGKARGDEDEDDPHKRIYRFFKTQLRQWEDELSRRPESTRRTAAGRNETKTVKQCKDYIRPLFKLCKKRTLEPGIMAHIVSIVDNCEKGEFVKAHDSYIDVAIGRAAWPMGVTMVGIHARSGREKISSSNVAHVMNSELQRKYLTSVKRLMSYYQKKRTDVDPSKKVLNM
uniref:Pre-mRNA-splicing factor 18 n=1 Tax=Trieres chinensis TaxID=1514140 RepID=A0A7S1ZHV8_TRICV|mmetsp:Transcript_26053/g.53330  ORF Transcript_26053/g.53330 Transcript_26053/m.53330 type:complete len:433 (+) Transcript_26053:171-1469(+)